MPKIENADRTIRTQKARGVLALIRSYTVLVPSTWLVQDETDIISVPLTSRVLANGAFARPCPMRPRHGFVESRLVKTHADLVEVWREAQAADNQAEMLVMPVLPAEKSAIITPAAVSIGPGHDGATAGNDSRVYPIAGFNMPPSVLSAAGIGDASPYLEVVRTFDRAWFVQLRAGPRVEGRGNFVPRDMRVRTLHKVTPDYDLLSFESFCAKHAREEGLVVSQPGGSRLSHAAVHAITNGIAIVFDADGTINVGDTLHASEGETAGYDAQAIQRGFDHAMFARVEEAKQNAIVRVGLYGLHHASALTGSASYWIGASVASIIRCNIAACFGEYRHARSKANGKHLKLPGARDKVYEEVFDDPAHYFQLLPRVHHSFMFHRWRESFGGPKWGECSLATFALSAAWHRWRANGNTAQLIAALNRAVNQVHNGGWLLNKFEMSEVFDGATSGDVNVVAKLVFAADYVKHLPAPNVQAWPSLKQGTRISPRVAVEDHAPNELYVRVGRPGFYKSGLVTLDDNRRAIWQGLKAKLSGTNFGGHRMARVPKVYWHLLGLDPVIESYANAKPTDKPE